MKTISCTRRTCSVLLTILFFNFYQLPNLAAQTATAQTATGQTATDTTTDDAANREEEARQAELREASLKLLREVISDSAALKLPDNRAYLRVSAANLLWTDDAAEARVALRDAAADLTQAMPDENSINDDQAMWRYQNLRRELLGVIATRDPQLALDTLRATRPVLTPEIEARRRRYMGGMDEETKLEHSLILQIAREDATQALRLAEASIAKGVTHEMLGLIYTLQEKNPEAAVKVRDMIVAKLLTTNFATEREAMSVAFQLIQSFGRQSANQMTVTLTSGTKTIAVEESAPKLLTLDKTALKDLSEALVNAYFTSNDDGLLQMLRSMQTELAQHISPARLAQLQRKFTQMGVNNDPRSRMWMDYQTVLNTGTTDAIVEAATKASADVRQPLYQAAAMRALHNENNTERARQIINEHFPANSPERGEMLRQIDQFEVQRQLSSSKFAEARAALDRITAPTERLNALLQLATRFAETNDRDVARNLLREAESLMPARPRNMEALSTRLRLARAYAQTEPDHSFEIIEPLVDQATELLQAASVLNGFMQGGEMFRDDEYVLFGTSGSNVFYQYTEQLRPLARHDLARTAKLANRFMRPEITTLAHLLIAQSVLADQPQVRMRGRGFGRGGGVGGGVLRRR